MWNWTFQEKRGKTQLEPEEPGRLTTVAKKTARTHLVLQSTIISDKDLELPHVKERQHTNS